jgi:hypothetical protein
MMEVFKQVKINLPLLDAIKQVLAYAKFLKDLCTQKRKNRNHIPKKVRLNIFNAFQHAPNQNECFFVDNIEEYVEVSLPSILARDPLEDYLTHFGSEDFNTNQYIDVVNALLETTASAYFHPCRLPKEPLPLTSKLLSFLPLSLHRSLN